MLTDGRNAENGRDGVDWSLLDAASEVNWRWDSKTNDEFLGSKVGQQDRQKVKASRGIACNSAKPTGNGRGDCNSPSVVCSDDSR